MGNKAVEFKDVTVREGFAAVDRRFTPRDKELMKYHSAQISKGQMLGNTWKMEGFPVTGRDEQREIRP